MKYVSFAFSEMRCNTFERWYQTPWKSYWAPINYLVFFLIQFQPFNSDKAISFIALPLLAPQDIPGRDLDPWTWEDWPAIHFWSDKPQRVQMCIQVYPKIFGGEILLEQTFLWASCHTLLALKQNRNSLIHGFVFQVCLFFQYFHL